MIVRTPASRLARRAQRCERSRTPSDNGADCARVVIFSEAARAPPRERARKRTPAP